MNALSPLRLDEAPAHEMFSLPHGPRAPSDPRIGLLGRLYDRFVAGWRHEPDLQDMGPSQINELLVLRGRRQD
jgi:hypothetical protein